MNRAPYVLDDAGFQPGADRASHARPSTACVTATMTPKTAKHAVGENIGASIWLAASLIMGTTFCAMVGSQWLSR